MPASAESGSVQPMHIPVDVAVWSVLFQHHLRGISDGLPFTDGDTGAQRDWVTCSRSLRLCIVETVSELRSLMPQPTLLEPLFCSSNVKTLKNIILALLFITPSQVFCENISLSFFFYWIFCFVSFHYRKTSLV